MNCLHRIYPSDGLYSSSNTIRIPGLRIALGIIAACGIFLSIGAIVSYCPPSAGYCGGAAAIIALCGLAVSYTKCTSQPQLSGQDESLLNSEINAVEPARKNSDAKESVSNTHLILNINEFPHEIKLHVLGYLSPRELITMGLLNHQWQDIAGDNVLWAQHCQNNLIPLPKVDAVNVFMKNFTQVQKCANVVAKKVVHPKIVYFNNPVFSVLISNNKIFISSGNELQLWNADFSGMNKILMSGEGFGRENRLKISDTILFWLCAPTLNPNLERKAILYSYDLQTDTQEKKGISIGLHEWEHGPSKHRKGHFVFSKNKAFCNYQNGDIRVWDLTKESQVYTDENDNENFEEIHNEIKGLEKQLLELKGLHPITSENINKQIEERRSFIQQKQQFQKQRLQDHPILKGHTGQISHLSIANDHLYSSSEDGTIKVWNVDTNQCVQTIITELSHSMQNTVLGIDHFLVHGNYIFGYMHETNHTVCKLWDTHTGVCLQTIDLNTPMDSYCLKGNLLFFSHATTIYVYNLSTGEKIQTLSCDKTSPLTNNIRAFSNLQIIDNKLICIGKERELDNYGKQIYIFDFSL